MDRKALYEYYRDQEEDVHRMYSDGAGNRQQQRRVDVIKKSLAGLNVADTLIVDLGAGDGYAASQILGGAPYRGYVGLDLSAGNLRSLTHRISRAAAVVADAQETPLQSESVDGVLCLEVLEHLLNPEVALKEIERVLRPGGFALISIPVDSPLQGPLISSGKKIKEIWSPNQTKFAKHIQIFTRRRFHSAVKSAGLRKVSKQFCCFNFPFWGPAVQRLPYLVYGAIDDWLSKIPVDSFGLGTGLALSIGRTYLVAVLQKPVAPSWRGLRHVYEERAVEVASSREARNGEIPRKYAAIVEDLDFTPGSRVLDAGCGTGPYTTWLAAQAYPVVATDISHRILLETRRRVEEETGLKKLPVAVSNLEQLPYKDNCFDAVVCSQVIEHLLDEAAGLRELYRVLRPGGTLVISTDNKQNHVSKVLDLPARMAKTLLRLPKSRWQYPHKEYGRMEFERMLRDSGFQIRKVRSFRFSMPAPLRGLSPALDLVEKFAIRLPGFKNWGDIISVVCEKKAG